MGRETQERIVRVYSARAIAEGQRHPDYLRTEFMTAAGKWVSHLPLKNPHTRRGHGGEMPPVRLVYKA